MGTYAVNYPASFDFLAAAGGANDASGHIQWMIEQLPEHPAGAGRLLAGRCRHRRHRRGAGARHRLQRPAAAQHARARRRARGVRQPVDEGGPAARRPARCGAAGPSTPATSAIRSAGLGRTSQPTAPTTADLPIRRPASRPVCSDPHPGTLHTGVHPNAPSKAPCTRIRRHRHRSGGHRRRASGHRDGPGRPAQVPTASAEPCAPVELIFARGRNEIARRRTARPQPRFRTQRPAAPAHRRLWRELSRQQRDPPGRQRHQQPHPVHGRRLPGHPADRRRLLPGRSVGGAGTVGHPVGYGLQPPAAARDGLATWPRWYWSAISSQADPRPPRSPGSTWTAPSTSATPKTWSAPVACRMT